VDLQKSILFDRRKTSDYPGVTVLTKRVEEDISLDGIPGSTKHTRQALKTTIMNLLEADQQGKCVAVSRRTADYTHNKRYGQLHWRRQVVTPILDRMEERGWTHQWIGFKNHETGVGRVTRVEATDRLREYATTNLGETPLREVVAHLPWEEVIHLKNSNKHLIGYKDTRDTRTWRGRLTKYNNLLNHTTLTLPHLTTSSSSTPSTVTGKNTPVMVGYPFDYVDKSKQLYRVFNDSSFRRGGRFYGAAYQGLSGDQRATLLINGNPVKELDYSSLHLSMVYHLAGLHLPDGSDPYVLLDDPRTRKLGKVLSLIALNASSRGAAASAFLGELHQSRMSEKPEKQELARRYDQLGYSISDLYDSMLAEHHRVASSFSSGVGIKLQYEDSKLADKVLDHFTHRDIPVLGVHDSFIVEERQAADLEAKMMEVYEQRFGFSPKVK